MLALTIVVGSGSTTCLPPDIDIAPVVNEPVTIDRTLIPSAIDPDRVITMQCGTLELNLGNAVRNPDGDVIFHFWFIDFDDAASAQESDNHGVPPFADPFTIDACDSSTINQDSDVPIAVRLVVRDRPTKNLGTEDEPKYSVLGADVMDTTSDPDVTLDKVVFFIHIEDFQCCVP